MPDAARQPGGVETANTPPADVRPSRSLIWSVAMISAAALGVEILLMRLFSIIQWHYFAYMMISVALLGYATSGVLLAIRAPIAGGAWARAYCGSSFGFALAAPGAFLIAERVPFNPLEILWDPWQWVALLVLYLTLALPFFFAANCVCLALSRYRVHQPEIYGADLLGAGIGALSVIGLMWELPPQACLAAAGIAGLVAACLGAVNEQGLPGRPLVSAAAATAAVIVATAAAPIGMSPYKPLARTLEMSGAEVLAERHGPLGILTVVRSDRAPFRHAPGLSLGSRAEPPAQLAVFADGDSMSAITRRDGGAGSLEFLRDLPSALPYHLLKRPSVLVLGAGGGMDVLKALVHDARSVVAVELNRQYVDLLRGPFAQFAGGLYDDPRVHVVVAEGRGFVTAGAARHDLIEIGLMDAFNAAAAGLHALAESHLYTVEALGEYLRHLTPAGVLSISRWSQLPPRDDLKLFATAVAALKGQGIDDPGRHLVWIRGWNVSTLLVAATPLDAGRIGAVREFCARRGFDTAWYPGMRPEEANRHSVWPQPYDHQGATALLGGTAEEFLTDYKFNVRPATDDRPYFFHFFKWRLFPEALLLRATGGIALLDLGYFVLIAALAQAVLAGGMLIALPLAIWGRRAGAVATPSLRARVLLYFGAIGLGFMSIEVAFIQKLILHLHHPLYAVAVVLTGFLIFAGLGSRRARSGGRRSPMARVAAIIAVLAAAYLVAIPLLFEAAAAAPDAMRIALALLVIAPLAYFMGQPFPLGLAALAGETGALTPWAFAINGCASVIGAMLATLLMIHLGIAAVVFLALFCYGLAAMTFPAGCHR